MTSGDETRWDDRPSLFDDPNRAEDTQVVQNPFPTGGQPPGRGPGQPPNRPARPSPALPPARFGPGGQQSHDPGHGGGLGGPPPGGDPPDGGFFDGGPGYPGDGRPTILANQAGGWEGNLQEMEVSRGGRTGMIALFLLGLVAVVVVALGLAAWSVLRGGDDETATDTTVDTSVPDSGVSTPDSALDTTTPTEVTPPVDPNALRVTVVEDPFVCDGGTREFALVGGADPNESVAFTSPQAEGLRSGQADGTGELPIRWQCDPTQAGTTWELTATGETSGRSVTFLFAGVADPAAPAPTEMSVEVIEDPFTCDGNVRVFAGLTGADPNETITFTSPQSPGLRPGQADVNGETPIRWVCDPGQAGTVWELTATGDVSGRSVTFSFTGA